MRDLLDEEDQEIWSLNSKLGIELEELLLLAPDAVRAAAHAVRQQLTELADLVTAEAPATERHEALLARTSAFESALGSFREAARRDLEP